MGNPPADTILCNPEPDPFNHIPGNPLRPHNCVQCSLTGIQVCFRRVPPLCPLQDLPEEEQEEVDWHANVVSDEAIDIEAASNRVEAVEEDNQAEKRKADPSQIRLERRLEYQGIAINTLSGERLVEHDIRNAN